MNRSLQNDRDAGENPEEVEFAILRGLVYLRREANGAELTRLAAAIGNVLARYLETPGESGSEYEAE